MKKGQFNAFKISMFFSLLVACAPNNEKKINAVVQDDITLKEVFDDKFLLGVAINRSQTMGSDKKATEVISEHFNCLSPENDLKWENIHPDVNRYDFGPADAYVNFGQQHNMVIIGHTLVWHSQTPDWVFEDASGNPLNREQLLQRLKQHITMVVGRYKGKIKGWDVVNEALNEDGTLRDSKWRKIIGDDFIEKAFEYAHNADPKAELYYNDYNLCKPEKRAGAVKLVKKLQSRGITITAVGEQAHYNITFPELSEVENTINDFSELGIHVNFTELDISVLPDEGAAGTADVSNKAAYKESLNPYTNGLPEEVAAQLADRYGMLFAIFVKEQQKIDRVTLWGLSDANSWLNDWPIKGRTNYPLLFDRDYRIKEEVLAKVSGNKK